MAALDDGALKQAHGKVLAWQDALEKHVETVNARRVEFGIPERVLLPKRERVILAPDAVRSARDAAKSRRSFAAAAEARSAAIADATRGPVSRKSDLDAKKPQRIGTSADLRKV